MAIKTTTHVHDTGEASGREIYAAMCARLSELPAGEQLTLGIAMQRQAQWATLSKPIRQALCELANDLFEDPE
jgi:hypothetical protein